MISVNEMKRRILEVYKSPEMERRVKDFSKKTIEDIYYRMLSSGRVK